MMMLNSVSTFPNPFKVTYFLHWDATGLGFVDQSLTFNSVLQFLIIHFSSTPSLTPHRHPMLKPFQSLDLSARLNRDKETGSDRSET